MKSDWMDGEISRFIKVWLAAYISLCYCYGAGKLVQNPARRLAAVIPVVALFLLLPLQLKSVHLIGSTAFFLAWLANFKLLMFVFNIGPLSNPSISLPKFVALACLPIKFQIAGEENGGKHPNSRKSYRNYAVKVVLLGVIVKIYEYESSVHPWIILVIYCLHIYLCLELMLAVAAAMAVGILGVDLEPQFDEPYLSTSLQDFWGRRWNLMVTGILRPTVYLPVLRLARRVVGRERASLPAVMATFIVSGLMHELMFFYLGRVRPTWEISWFFLLHGTCLAAEIAAKKAAVGLRPLTGVWRRLFGFVTTVLTLGFLVATSSWLFFPQLLRCKADERALTEISAVVAFITNAYRTLIETFNQ